jgi:hypothetical protein
MVGYGGFEIILSEGVDFKAKGEHKASAAWVVRAGGG